MLFGFILCFWGFGELCLRLVGSFFFGWYSFCRGRVKCGFLVWFWLVAVEVEGSEVLVFGFLGVVRG